MKSLFIIFLVLIISRAQDYNNHYAYYNSESVPKETCNCLVVPNMQQRIQSDRDFTPQDIQQLMQLLDYDEEGEQEDKSIQEINALRPRKKRSSLNVKKDLPFSPELNEKTMERICNEVLSFNPRR